MCDPKCWSGLNKRPEVGVRAEGIRIRVECTCYCVCVSREYADGVVRRTQEVQTEHPAARVPCRVLLKKQTSAQIVETTLASILFLLVVRTRPAHPVRTEHTQTRLAS